MRSFYIAPSGDPPGRLAEAVPDAAGYTKAVVASLEEASLIWLMLTRKDGLKPLQEILALPMTPRVIVLSNEPNAAEALDVFKQGAHGYCHAYAVPALLQQAATVVANGGIWVGPEFMPYLLRGVDALLGSVARDTQATEDESIDIDVLTAREREVVEQVCDGLSNKEIARQLDITERTVKAHIGAIFEKLGFRDRVQLIIRLKPLLNSSNKQ